MQTSTDHSQTSRPRRWDIVVRSTHWLVVAAVLLNALVTEEGSNWHVWVGYALAAILALRLLWGLVGPAEARFSAFPPSPGRAVRHIGAIAQGEVTHHRSHNPLGALMVYAIWGTLIVIIGTGIAMAGSPVNRPADHRDPAALSAPPAAQMVPIDAEEAGDGDEDADEAREAAGEDHEEGPLTEVHEVAVNLLYLLILLHLAGVVFETRRSGRQIMMAMLPGRR